MFIIHVNTTTPKNNAAIMALSDQKDVRKNITNWTEMRPAFYHGHFAFLPFGEEVNYINIIRDPLQRLVSYYYFIRYGDNFRVGLKRSKQGDKTTFNECVLNDTSKVMN